MDLDKDTLFKVVKPLYGVPLAGNHWFNTYHKLHTENLKMSPSTYDNCLLYKYNPKNIFDVITGMQTDDTLSPATDGFAAIEQKAIKNASIISKPIQKLIIDNPLMLNGAVLKRNIDHSVSVTQPRQCQNLDILQDSPSDSTLTRCKIRKGRSLKEQYVAQRVQGAYTASVCQTEAAFDYSIAAQMNKDVFLHKTKNDRINMLNKRIKWQLDNPNRGLTFKTLNLDSVKLVVYTDVSHANNSDMSS